MADTPSPEEVLAQLERRRREIWAVGALLVLAVLLALGLLIVDEDAVARYAPLVALAFVGVTGLFAASVLAQERRATRMVRALLAEHEQVGALRARVGALETLHGAVRDVAAADRIEDVLDRLTTAAVELTGADAGATLLRVGDQLTVASALGPGSPSVGERLDLHQGVAGEVVRTGRSQIAGRGGEWSAPSDPSVVAAPLRLPDRVVGALLLERREGRPPFDPVDRTAVALFAEQAALAMRGTDRLERERERADDLERDLRERSTLASTVVHDLRAPLSAIGGYLQLLRDRDERIARDDRLEMYEVVLAEAGRLGTMLENLLAAEVAESGTPVTRRQVDLGDLIRGAARVAHGLALEQGADREIEVEEAAAVVVRADPGALERVLTNLVDNAVAFSPPGSPLALSVHREGDEAVLGVRDHGGGIEEDLEDQIFDRSVSLGGGTGLGLYVVRSLVEAHDGRVRLESAEGGGTRAVVRLPLDAAT